MTFHLKKVNFFLFSESFQFTHSGPEFKVKAKNHVRFVNVNHPLPLPKYLKYRTTMIAPSGTNLQLILPTQQVEQNCTQGSYIQVRKEIQSLTKILVHFVAFIWVKLSKIKYGHF